MALTAVGTRAGALSCDSCTPSPSGARAWRTDRSAQGRRDREPAHSLLRRRGVARLRHDHVGQRVGLGLHGCGRRRGGGRRGLSRSGLRWRCGGCCRSLRRGGLRHGHGRDLRGGGTVFSRGVVTMSWLGGDRRCGVCFFGTESVRDGATPLPCARQGADAASKPQAASATALAIRIVISFLPPGPGLLTITRTWLLEAGPFSRRKHHDFQALRGFFRAGLN